MVKNRVFHYLEPKAAGLVLFAVFGGAECRAFAAAPHKFLRAAQRQWRSEVTPADRRLIRKADTALACLKLTEDFSLKKLAVDISGAPYVIIDNSTLYDNSPVDSTDTASVQGVPDPLNMAYEWTISPDINNLSTLSGAPNTLPVDGAGPEGAGNITCVAYSNGTNQSGSKQVTVQDEYVEIPNPGYTTNIGEYTIASNAVLATANDQPITFTVTGTVSYTYGITTTSGIDLTLLENFLSVSASKAKNESTTTAVGGSTATGPPASDVIAGTYYWLTIAPDYHEYTGIQQTWGTSGLLRTSPWTNQQLYTWVEKDAQSSQAP